MLYLFLKVHKHQTEKEIILTMERIFFSKQQPQG
jgi:hypothetical protein